MPRRLMAVRRRSPATANNTLCCATNGTAEPMLASGRRDRHRDGQHVVDEQRAGHRQPRGRPEVRGHDLVVAAAGRVGVHVLPVAGDHDEHHDGDRETDPRRHRVRRQTRHRQHQEDLLRRVGDRRHRVGGEHGQRDPLGQQRVPSVSLRNGRPSTSRRAAVESLDTRAQDVPAHHGPVSGRSTAVAVGAYGCRSARGADERSAWCT